MTHEHVPTNQDSYKEKAEKLTETAARLLYINWQLVLLAAPTSETGIALTDYIGAAKDPMWSNRDATLGILQAVCYKKFNTDDRTFKDALHALDVANGIPPF